VVNPTASASTPFFPAGEHDHGDCVTLALARAAEICNSRGVRLTVLRRRVLELIWGNHKPIGAYEILDGLGAEGRSAAPPTVYRALEFLLSQGLIHRIEHLNAYMGCCTPGMPHAGQFLVCRTCGAAAEINDSRIEEAIRSSASEAGFIVARPTIEVEGVCPHCKDDDGSPAHG
jgi:Fur family zinc uptake transcriptional regulator